jgi:hypothetical protein
MRVYQAEQWAVVYMRVYQAEQWAVVYMRIDLASVSIMVWLDFRTGLIEWYLFSFILFYLCCRLYFIFCIISVNVNLSGKIFNYNTY